MIDGKKYESYLEMDADTKRLCVHLLLHEYFQYEDYTDAQIYSMMKADLKRFERNEQFEMCSLVLDAIKYLFSYDD